MRKRDIFQSLLIFYVLGLHFGIGFCVATPAPHPAAYQFTVNYGEYCYLYNTCETSIDWSFSGSNTFIGLEAWIFNEENFKKFQNDESPTGWKVSSGSYYADQGSQALNDCDVWYFVVINSDPDQQSTVITIDAIFYGACDPNAIEPPDDIDYDWDFSDLDLSDFEDPKTILIIILIVVVVILIIVIISKSKN